MRTVSNGAMTTVIVEVTLYIKLYVSSRVRAARIIYSIMI